ncbi:hypothetical protein THAOC_19947, partial [Thalassiosira oceanica]
KGATSYQHHEPVLRPAGCCLRPGSDRLKGGAAEQEADYSSRGKGQQRRAGPSPARPGETSGKRQEDGQASGSTARRTGYDADRRRRPGRSLPGSTG